MYRSLENISLLIVKERHVISFKQKTLILFKILHFPFFSNVVSPEGKEIRQKKRERGKYNVRLLSLQTNKQYFFLYVNFFLLTKK